MTPSAAGPFVGVFVFLDDQITKKGDDYETIKKEFASDIQGSQIPYSKD
jgi:hypothetical protein